MSPLVAIIAAGDRQIQALLAAEALRRAARDHGASLEVEVQVPQGVLSPLSPAALAAARGLLLVGGALPPEALAGLPQTTATLDDVLGDAEGLLARAAPGGAAASPAAAPRVPEGPRRIVGITSCPTGIAHTFMAAEGLQQAAKALGHAIRVETQGSVGAQDRLTPEEIAAADLVVIAADTQVDLGRFGGKRVFVSGTKPAINDGKALLARAFAEAELQAASGAAPAREDAKGKGSGPYRHLMTGVSFMLPFTVAGGLLIALAFALGGIYVFDEAHQGSLAQALFQIGAKGAFALMVPALAGYIAYSVADRPGIAPGMVGGMVAANLNAGFLGGIAAGFIAGYGVAWMNRLIRLPRTLEGLKPVLILPLLGTLLTGLAMIYVVGAPTATLLALLTEWLRGMQGSSAILLGLIIGGMMAFDMGGPVNKSAYAFSTGLIASQVYSPMAAAMVAGMTPPLGIALAAFLFRDRFTAEEREAAPAGAVLGLAFVSEGAIPFAAKDPLRVIPALMLGSALAGAISMGFGAELKVPHGGVFVLPIPNAVTHLGGYVLALLAGTVLTALALRLVKKPATA